MEDKSQQQLDKKMKSAIDVMKKEFATLRTGRASVSLIDSLQVEYYGSMLPLNQVATLSVQDPRTIAIQPWDKSIIPVIEKEIQKANLGFNPINDGTMIRINIPAPTEERRKELVRIVGRYAESARIAIRNVRRDGNDETKKLEKKKEISEDELHHILDKIQKLTDRYISIIEETYQKKEKDILTI